MIVARSPDEADFLAKGGTLVAETERAALEAAEAARRAAEQAAALFEAKPAEAVEGEDCRGPGAAEEAKPEASRKSKYRIPANARFRDKRPPSHARDSGRFLVGRPENSAAQERLEQPRGLPFKAKLWNYSVRVGVSHVTGGSQCCSRGSLPALSAKAS